jgi:hypothetical protein
VYFPLVTAAPAGGGSLPIGMGAEQEDPTWEAQSGGWVRRCFVGGPPGAGKTYVGEVLEGRYGWVHFDCERFHRESDAGTFEAFLDDPGRFVPSGRLVVVTWGFIPPFAGAVRWFVDAGYCPVWLHGDRSHLGAALGLRARCDPAKAMVLTDELWGVVAEAKAAVEGWRHVDAFTSEGGRWDVAALIASWAD